MILDFLGIFNHSELLIAKLQPSKEDGVPHGKIIAFISEIGLYSYVNNNSSTEIGNL